MAILYACWLKIKQHPVAALSALGALLAIPIVIALFIFTIITGGTADDGSSGNCSTDSDQSYTADFKIKDWGPAASKHANASKDIEKWAASQHLNAAQTAGVLGNAMAESGVGTNGSGGGKYGDFLGAGATAADTSHNGDSASAYMNWFVNTFSNTGKSTGGHNNGAWNEYKSMKSSSPYTLGYFWGKHLDADAAENNEARGHWAEDAYKTISGSSSNITTAADTSESGSNSKCGQSSDDDSGSGNAIVKEAIHVMHVTHGGHYTLTSDWREAGQGYSCCTSFVSYVLDKTGYGPMASQYCPEIISELAAHGKYGNLRSISSSQAKAGSIVIEHGHCMLMLTRWYGKNSPKTKVIDMRGNPGVHIDTYHDADLQDLANKPYFAKAVK